MRQKTFETVPQTEYLSTSARIADAGSLHELPIH